MPTRKVKLTDHFGRFIDELVQSGRFQDASEVMTAALRLLEEQVQEHRDKLKALRELAAEGFRQIDQGEGIQINSKRDLVQLMDTIDRRAISASKRRSSGPRDKSARDRSPSSLRR